jgi:type I restriction enzyme S subunit
MNNDLPDGWQERDLVQCVDVLDSRRVPVNSEERAKREGKVPYYGATGQVGWIDDYLFQEELLLLGEDGAPFLDKSKSISYIISGKSWVNNHAHVLRAKSEITSNKYLNYFFDFFDFGDFVNGTTRLKLTQSAMKRIPVLLAPLMEQRRIVAKLEELFGRIEACQARLARIPLILKRLRESVLGAACSGKMTEDWREQHRGTTESLRAFLSQVEDQRMQSARSPTERKRLQDLFEMVEEGDDEDLPTTWAYVRLGKLCTSFDYGTSAKSEKAGKIPVLRMGNIQSGQIDWSDLVYTSDKDEISKYLLRHSTVLFNRTNSPELVGKAAIYRGERPAIFAGYLIRVNPTFALNPEYLNLCLNSPAAKEFCLQVKTDGVSQSNINAQKLSSFEVPYCLPEEQEEIVRRTSRLLSLADQIESCFRKGISRTEKLKQSLLAKAFRGELVPTKAEL